MYLGINARKQSCCDSQRGEAIANWQRKPDVAVNGHYGACQCQLVRRGGSGSGSGSWSERGQVIRGNYTGTTRTPKAVATITHTHTDSYSYSYQPRCAWGYLMLFTGQSLSCHWPLTTGRKWLESGSWPQHYLHWLGFILAITIAPWQMAHWSIYGQVPCVGIPPTFSFNCYIWAALINNVFISTLTNTFLYREKCYVKFLGDSSYKG